MREHCRFICAVLAVLMLISTVLPQRIYVVHAAEEDLRNVYACLTSLGLSDVAAAAIVGNAAGESGGRTDAVEHNNAGTGKGIGIFQWSTGNRDDLVDYCAGSDHSGHEKVTLTPDVGGSFTVCNRTDCQVAFMIKNAASTMDGRHWSRNYNDKVSSLSVLKQGAADGKIPSSVNITSSWDGFKSQTSLEYATIQFLCDYETPSSTKCFWVGNSGYSETDSTQNSFLSSYNTRFTHAKTAFDSYSGSVYVPPADGNNMATGVASQLYSAGLLSESELANFCKLTEVNIEDVYLAAANKENLGQVDLESLTDWNRNKGMQEEQNGYISILRRVVVLVGILLTLWAILVYLAYWFDHINTLFYIDTLHLVTLGQLHICPPGDKPTFSLGKKVKTRTVSHMQILGVCATAILFGVLLISGVFYTIVAKFVNLILGVLNR